MILDKITEKARNLTKEQQEYVLKYLQSVFRPLGRAVSGSVVHMEKVRYTKTVR
jgi:hypothetical protein